jgi:hypothetical protein
MGEKENESLRSDANPLFIERQVDRSVTIETMHVEIVTQSHLFGRSNIKPQISA